MAAGRSVLLAGAAFALGLAARGAQLPDLDAPALIAGAVPTAATRAAAEGAGISLSKGAAGGAGSADSVTALVVLAHPGGGTVSKQWIVRFTMEAAGHPAERSIAFYSNAGDRFVFHTGQAQMDVRMVGPVPPGGEAAHDEQIQTGADFLRLDLTRTAQAIEKMKRARQTKDLVLEGSTDRIGNPDARAVREAFERLGIGAADRRSFMGGLPALAEFFQVASRTPGLRDILFEVVKKPSVFSLIRSGGDPGVSVHFLSAGRIGMWPAIWSGPGAADLCNLIFEISAFGRPVLTVGLAVVPPAPPLEASAGIVGAMAFAPDAQDRVLLLRVVSTSRGI